MNFVLKASLVAVEKYITKKEKNEQAPSHCFISLDISNMFNKISKDKCFEIIEQKYLELLPLVLMLQKEKRALFSSRWQTGFVTPKQ